MPLDPRRIRALLEARKMSQAELARSSGIADPNITRLVSGQRTDPNLSTVERLADALGCGVEELISPARVKGAKRR